jgi:hypothetical protein
VIWNWFLSPLQTPILCASWSIKPADSAILIYPPHLFSIPTSADRIKFPASKTIPYYEQQLTTSSLSVENANS